MSNAKKNNNPADDLLESLLKDIQEGDQSAAPELLGLNDFPLVESEDVPNGLLISSHDEIHDDRMASDGVDSSTNGGYNATRASYESTRVAPADDLGNLDIKFDSLDEVDAAMNPLADSLFDSPAKEVKKSAAPRQKKSIEELIATSNKAPDEVSLLNLQDDSPVPKFNTTLESERTLAIESIISKSKLRSVPVAATNPAADLDQFYQAKHEQSFQTSNDDRTVAVTGFQNLKIENYDDKVKVSIGQNRLTGYQSWGGGAEASLGQAENLRIAQEKILQLERENEKLRSQNDELISASDIIKERSDLLTAQIIEFKNDKEGLEESFKNEVALLKGHLNRKETEFQKAQIKVDDLESRLKFDMKKVRVRERELENRLELIRAEKNAVTKSKDDQILDLRRKMDVLQMEVDSYRQKCVDLNKLLENNQDSFKRTTRALRLAMANLELQEENKVSVSVALKKVD